MRKRLRKKKHLNEFKELGVEISIQLKDEGLLDTFWFDFITGAIEGNNLSYGGGEFKNRLKGFVWLGPVGEEPFQQRKMLMDWLDSRKDIETYHISELKDAWYCS